MILQSDYVPVDHNALYVVNILYALLKPYSWKIKL